MKPCSLAKIIAGKVSPGITLAIALVFSTTAHSQDYAGANTVIQKIQNAKNAKPAPDDKKDELAKFRSELTNFTKSAPALPPADAAKQWLELVDRAAKLKGGAESGGDPTALGISGRDLVLALPPPSAWSDLAKAIAARPPAKVDDAKREVGLRLLGAVLTGDTGGRKRQVSALQSLAEKADEQSAFEYQGILQELDETLLETAGSPDEIIQSLDRRAKLAGANGQGTLAIPNLVPVVGAEKATACLRRLLARPNLSLEFTSPNETSRLAGKLALELIDQLKTPQWGLVNSLESVPLYEALDKKFAKEADDAADPANSIGLGAVVRGIRETGDYEQTSAQTYYLLGLISQNRVKEAVAVAKKLGRHQNEMMTEPAYEAMERAGYTLALDDFFFELLTQDPGLQFWDQYMRVAAQAGRTGRMLDLARAAAAREDLGRAKQATLQRALFRALLAADEVDEAAREMKKLIAGDTPADEESTSPGQIGLTLAKIGILLNKPEWADAGIAGAKKWIANQESKPEFFWGLGGETPQLAEILLQLKRGPEAEAALEASISQSFRQQQLRGEPEMSAGFAPSLTKLAVVYNQAGRSADVVSLLQNAPWWGARDLLDLSARPWIDSGDFALNPMHTPTATSGLPDIAARALAAVGRKPEAWKITTALLDRQPGLDRGYELLIELGGTNTVAKLDELFARDPFEERPLIWKAHLLRTQGKLEEAEKYARQAIAIDPSDGEEGPGDRMRAYSELADIRDARGDQKEAEFFRGAVQAIRLSEQADQFYMAGLLKRAIRMYEESLTHFTDAYCIQSRLAIQMSALGMNDEAEKHYRRAYELMPNSFGRVESHCFGCEKAFAGEKAQSLAETVFTKLAVERPEKPQVHYLLGYLHEEQEKFNEAATNYLAAVRLDPDYLNAWFRLAGITDKIAMAADRRDEITFNIVRLDPLRRHARVNFDKVNNLAALWQAVDAGAKRRPPVPTSLFPLTASQEAMDKVATDRQGQFRNQFRASYFMEQQQPPTPASAVADNTFVKIASQLLSPSGAGSFVIRE